MTYVNVTEFKKITGDRSGFDFPAPLMPPETTPYNLDPASSGDTSDPFTEGTRYIRVYAKTACVVNVGFSSSPSTDGVEMATGQVEYFGVKKGMTISVIDPA